MLERFGFDGKTVREKFQSFITGLRGQRAVVAYSAAFMLVVGGGAVFALAAQPHFFSRPQVALSAAASAAASTTAAKVITAQGEIVPLHELGIEAPFTAQIRSIDVTNAEAIQKGTTLVHLNDDAVQTEVETAKKVLAAAQVPSAAPATTTDHLSLSDTYDAGFTAASDAALLLAHVMQQQDAFLFGSDVSSSHTQQNLYAYFDMVKNSFPDVQTYQRAVERDYQAAQIAYKSVQAIYNATSRTSPQNDIENFMNATYATLKSAAQLLKSSDAFLSFIAESLKNQNKNVPQQLPEAEAQTSDIAHAVNDSLFANLNTISALKSAKNPVARETPSDASTVDAAQRALTEAEAKFDAYVIRSPVRGKIAGVHVHANDAVQGGQELITIISEENIVHVALEASDLHAVRAGAKADVTLATGDILKGTVMHVDESGVSIGFEKSDARVKPGMSVSVQIMLE